MEHRREARLREFAELLSARITEVRKEASPTVDSAKLAFRTFADTLPCIVWTAKPDGQVTWFNRRWYEALGMTGTEWESRVHPDDRQVTVDAWGAAVATGTPFHHHARVHDAQGVFHQIVSRAQPVRDESGTVLYWIGSSNLLANAAAPHLQVA